MNETKTQPWWAYENLPSGEPYDWGGAARTDHPDDNTDFHLDLGCGRLKKGRLGIDRFEDPGVDIVMDLDQLYVAGYGERPWELTDNPAESLLIVQGRLPFPTNSIKSIVSHHALEHIDGGFIRLMDECFRVLEPGGIFRAIVPLFPSHSAVADPDHKRYFMRDTFRPFEGDDEGNSWMESFSTPYTTARFQVTHDTHTIRHPDPFVWWTPEDARELRITLTKPIPK